MRLMDADVCIRMWLARPRLWLSYWSCGHNIFNILIGAFRQGQSAEGPLVFGHLSCYGFDSATFMKTRTGVLHAPFSNKT